MAFEWFGWIRKPIRAYQSKKGGGTTTAGAPSKAPAPGKPAAINGRYYLGNQKAVNTQLGSFLQDKGMDLTVNIAKTPAMTDPIVVQLFVRTLTKNGGATTFAGDAYSSDGSQKSFSGYIAADDSFGNIVLS